MKTYLEKAKERRKSTLENLKKDLKSKVKQLIPILLEKGFKFKRVYIFGSIVGSNLLAPWSDIDLAIEGSNKDEFFRLYAYLLNNLKFPVDLKPWEELSEKVKEKIVRRGEVIYEE